MLTVENTYKKAIRDMGGCRHAKAITDIIAKRFGLNVAFQDANKAKKHESLYN